MSKPREKTQEELTAEIEDGKKKIRHFEKAGDVINATYFAASSRRKTHVGAIEKAEIYLSKTVFLCEV